MTIDIAELDVLPETEPIGLAGYDELGLRPCYGSTCLSTCFFITCWITEW